MALVENGNIALSLSDLILQFFSICSSCFLRPLVIFDFLPAIFLRINSFVFLISFCSVEYRRSSVQSAFPVLSPTALNHWPLAQISNPHFKWGSNESPSRAFPRFRLRRGFAVPFLLAASLERPCYFLPSSSLSFSSCSLM